ncbi:MAG: hypothetical protein N3A66_03335 [Planctomycetota bacterium]|nr:hypothetical protein [Planctomycetota bacterium]
MMFAGVVLAAFIAGWLANESRFAARLSSAQEANALVISSLEERVRQQELALNQLRQGAGQRASPPAPAPAAPDTILLPRHLLCHVRIWPALTPQKSLHDDLVEILRLTDQERAAAEAALRQAWDEIAREEAKKISTLETHDEKVILAIAPFPEDGAAVKMRLQKRLAEVMGQRRAEDLFTMIGEQIDRFYLDFGRYGRIISIALRQRGGQTLYEILEERQETAHSRQPLSGRLVPSLPAEWRRYERWLPPALKAGLPPAVESDQEKP